MTLDPTDPTSAASASPLRVLVLSLDPEDASARTRFTDLAPALLDSGVSIDVQRWPEWATRKALVRNLPPHDVVVLQRVLVEETTLRPLRRNARCLVLDMDDAIDQRPWGRRASRRLGRKYRGTLAAVDAVTCGSQFLCDRVRESGVEHAHWVPPATSLPQLPPRAERAPHEPFRLLWLGSRHTLPYLDDLGAVLRDFTGEDALIEVVADEAPEWNDQIRWEFTPWSPQAEAEALLRAHVGLYPLRDDSWSRGKCAYKVRRYMSYGLATIASPQGGGKEALEEAKAGLFASNHETWFSRMERLQGAPTLCLELGQRGRQWAEEHNSFAARARSLAEILRETAKRATSSSPGA